MDHASLIPLFANAVSFAVDKLTTEGKVTIIMLIFTSLFSWTVMISKGRQLFRATTMAKKFFGAYRATRDPLELHTKELEFVGAPAYEVYYTGAEELVYHLKHNPVVVAPPTPAKSFDAENAGEAADADADPAPPPAATKISSASFESVRVALERAVSAQAISLEKGMIILSTAVAGGPFIGLLGTVWGVMETFSGIAQVQAASLVAMAPGVAAALLATVTGLFVAIPAMFAYNYMITTIRAITQELDNFTSEYATAIEHGYVDNRPISDEIADALRKMRAAPQAVPAFAGA
ncbi:MAG: MotA/TolQ/ExbB proton channel family protein [Verrucomicrobia bacterium]|nr:MotA/TolQ/ExbB proton channel family protein [Verrucomicrobiota bacterium]